MASENGAPTIIDVARVAGVSVGSVSRVLNSNPSVTARVSSKVRKAIAELDYRPNTAAQSMRSQVSKTVGCIIRDIDILGLASFVRAAHDVFLEAGYALLLSNSEGRVERERQLISVMASRRADALLIAQCSETDPELIAGLERAKVPIVLFDREHPDWADAVTIDHRGGIRRAIGRLVQLGHTRIALITGGEALFPARERIIGFKKAHEDLGLAVNPAYIRAGSFQAAFGYEQTSLLVSLENRPTAILAGGIEMLPGIIRALRMKGLSIPQDISLVGTLNSDLAELYEPPISVIKWNYSDVGRTAARFALDRLRGNNSPACNRLIVPTEFVMRESCGAAPKTSGILG